MHKLRVAAAATVVAIVAAFASLGQAHAAGVGTAESSTSLVDLAVGSAGSLLHLRVLGDDAKSTVDPGVGPTSAFSQLFALKATSTVLPALNAINTPLMESKAPGGSSPVATPVLNLGTLLPSLPVLNTSILSGSLPSINLTSAITNGVAQSGLSGKVIDNVAVLGGLIKIDAVNSTLGAASSAASSDGNRTIDVGAVSVLNLGALLRGLGIDPANLPVSSISGLLSGLGENGVISQLPAGATLGQFVATLNSTISTVQAQITALGGGTFGQLTGPIVGTLNGLGLPIATAGTIPDPTNLSAVLGSVTGLLDTVLHTALSSLDGINLLKLDGLHIGTVTKAVDSASGSKSDVVGTLGGVSIGNLPVLSGLDLGATLSQVTGLVNSIQGTLDGVLAPLGLDGLIKVSFFDKPSTNGVTTSGGYVRSLAGITGLGVSVTPPTNLLGIINSLVPSSGIGSAILANNSTATVPVVGGLMNSLNLTGGGLPAVDGVVGALAGGLSLKVAAVTTGSNFAAPSSASPVSSLPRTGANTTVWMVIGMFMVGAALVARRYMPRRVHAEK